MRIKYIIMTYRKNSMIMILIMMSNISNFLIKIGMVLFRATSHGSLPFPFIEAGCDTRFAKKRSWGLFFLFFFPHPVVVLGIWDFVENIHN
jgi:hypothetical protein